MARPPIVKCQPIPVASFRPVDRPIVPPLPSNLPCVQDPNIKAYATATAYSGLYKELWLNLLERRKNQNIQTVMRIVGRGNFQIPGSSYIFSKAIVHLVHATLDGSEIYLQDLEEGYWVTSLSHHRTFKFLPCLSETYDEYIDEHTNLPMHEVLNLPFGKIQSKT